MTTDLGSDPGSDLGTAGRPSEDEVLQAFWLIDRRRGRLADEPESVFLVALAALRERLAGELVGDADRVGATLSLTFTLVTHAGGTTTTSRDVLLGSVRKQGEAGGGALVWLHLTDLVVDGVGEVAVAGQGSLETLLTASAVAGRGRRNLAAGELVRTTVPIAFVIRFVGGLMASEALYLDTASATSSVLSGASMPDPQRLLGRLDGRPETLGH